MNEVKLLPEQAVVITQALVDWNFKGGHISNINELRTMLVDQCLRINKHLGEEKWNRGENDS